jgi:hypothetical protein
MVRAVGAEMTCGLIVPKEKLAANADNSPQKLAANGDYSPSGAT